MTTPTTPAARLREAADVLTVVDQLQRGELTRVPGHITEAQCDTACEIPSNVRTALAAWLESVAARLEATAHPEWQHLIEPEALALADAVLATATR
jgi:hypothetical protein